MLTLGEFTEGVVEKGFDNIRAQTISIYKRTPDDRTSQSRAVHNFSEGDVIALRGISGVIAASGSLSVSVKSITAYGTDLKAPVTGIDLDFPLTTDVDLIEGEHLSASDFESAAPVAIISNGIVTQLFKEQYALGQTFKINGLEFVVKGVVSRGNGDGTSPYENYIWIPLNVARQRLVGGDRFVKNHIDNLEVIGEKHSDFDYIDSKIYEILRERRQIDFNKKFDFRTHSFRSMREEYAKSTKVIGYILAAMGSIALLVGGIGVMNVMLMTVSERTSEIGLRMAMGAFESDIMCQFLIESAILCLLSSLFGVGFGYGVIAIINVGMDGGLSISPSFRVGLYSLNAALFIGVIFGFFPARRAAKMLPIDALRHE